jgi:signal transduction histidine kinase
VTPVSVLLIEDNDIDARIYRAKLQGAPSPVSIERVATLSEAVRILPEKRFDAILLDLNLPDSNGVSTLDRLIKSAGNTPVVVLTGEEDGAEASRALKLGAQDFVSIRDFEPILVSRIVRYAIERSEAERERKALSTQLINAQRLESLGQLAAGIAHEINTPIQFIGDNTTFARDAVGDLIRWVERIGALAAGEVADARDEALRELAKEMESADFDYLRTELPKALEQTLEGVGRVAQIVRAMKELAHPGSREKGEVDLHHVIETAVTVSRNTWKYVADVECRFDPTLGPIPGFAAELNQVFLNLIVNAAQAIEDAAKSKQPGYRGAITISTKRLDDAVEVRVQDTGCGIPEAIRHRVFDPFFTTKEAGRGTGQGLSIVFSAIVTKHGGTVEIESTAEGSGTCFRLCLPIRE